MNGTEYARISGSYSTAYIGTYEVLNQSTANNSTTFRLRGYFYYGGGASVSSSYSTFEVNGTSVKTGSYNYNHGYHLLGQKDITVIHNSNGTFPSTTASIYANSYHINGTKTGSLSAPKIDRLAMVTSGMNFNDENNPSVSFTNPANFLVAPYMNFYINNNLVASLERAKGNFTSPYTWELTEAERTQIRTSLSNVNSCVVSQGFETYNGNTRLGYNSKTYTFSIINANPTFNDFSFEDINSKTLTLTGNNQKVIQGYSNVKVTITESNKAIANKNATMSRYSFVCSDIQNDIPYSSDSTTNGIINNVKSGVFNVYAIDSRNNSTLVTKHASETINYTPLTKGDITIVRDNGVAEKTTLTITGVINLVNFGSVTNSIKEAKYRYRTTDETSTWSEYKNITISVGNDGTFTFNNLIQGDTDEGFDIGNSYNIQVIVSDELSTITYTANLGSAIPNIALHKNGVGIMGKYDETIGGLLQVAGEDVMAKFDDFYYKDDDTFEVINELDCAGMLSANSKKVYFTLPLDKSLKYINTITINSLNCEVRHATGGYMATDVELSTLGTLSVSKASNNALKIIWTLTTASSYTNNLPVIVSIESCRITFNE